MRHLFLAIILIAGAFQFVEAQGGSASDGASLRERLSRRQDATARQQQKGLPQLSVRAENMNQSQTQDITNVPWMREIYRTLDLDNDKNASLYYPESPIGDRMNLFTMMFKLLQAGDVVAYQYSLNGQESFTEQNKLDFKILLDNNSIMYTEKDGAFQVEDVDIPSNEVLKYYVKEAWYFDASNSVVDVKILALCPVIVRQDDFDAGSTNYPLFWMPYENIRPYAARMPIMTSNLNNASTQTVDDYFRKRSFEGEIYKTTNMRNKALVQMFPTDSLMKKEQKRIEGELQQFKKNLWEVKQTAAVKPATNDAQAKAEPKATKEQTDDSSNNSVPVRTNEKKIEKAKTQKSTAPARSMRGRRR